MAFKLTPGRAVGAVLATALTWGMTTCGINRSVRNDRLVEAKRIAKDSCSVRSDDPFLAEQLRSQCEGRIDSQIDNQVDRTDRDLDRYDYFAPIEDPAGNRSYANLIGRAGPELTTLARDEFNKRVHWQHERQAFENAVQNVVVDGKKPFAGASVEVELFELQPDRQAAGAVTGDFQVTVTGRGGVPGGKGSNIYAYNYARREITQTIDARPTTIDLSGAGDYVSLWNMGGGSFSMHGEMKTERALTVACGRQNYPACAVVDAVHRVLNGFDADELKYLEAGLDRLSRQGTDRHLSAVATFPGTSL